MKKITRKDGIEFSRKSKTINYDFKTTIKLSKDQHERAVEKADQLGISFNELVRQAIELSIKERKLR